MVNMQRQHYGKKLILKIACPQIEASSSTATNRNTKLLEKPIKARCVNN